MSAENPQIPRQILRSADLHNQPNSRGPAKVFLKCIIPIIVIG